jgi:hypothetical protein
MFLPGYAGKVMPASCQSNEANKYDTVKEEYLERDTVFGDSSTNIIFVKKEAKSRSTLNSHCN